MVASKDGFLWNSGQSTTGLETDAVVSSSEIIGDEYDVVVIGAGFAGLTAARDLGQLKVLIVEARDRIGGRAFTSKALNQEFEMGGTWMHWSQPHVYRELSRYGLHRNLKTSSGAAPEHQYYQDAAGKFEILHDDNETTMDRLAEKCFSIDGLSSRELMPYPHDTMRDPAPWKDYDYLSIRERLDHLTDEPQNDRDQLETNLSSFGSTTGEKSSFSDAMRWYALAGHTLTGTWEMAGMFKLGAGGTTSLAKTILAEAKCDILMNAPISAVEQHEKSVSVTTVDGQTFKARYCVCTVPINVLPTIKFQPPFPAIQQEAIDRGHLNKGAKIHFQLAGKQTPWAAAANAYGSSAFSFTQTDHETADSTFCVSFGYNDRIPDSTDHEHIIAAFKQSMRPDAEVQAYLTHDWANDPYSKGTWAAWPPNAMSKYLDLLRQRNNRVYPASADWAGGYCGFIDGAIEQGARAAMDILNAEAAA